MSDKSNSEIVLIVFPYKQLQLDLACLSFLSFQFSDMQKGTHLFNVRLCFRFCCLYRIITLEKKHNLTKPSGVDVLIREKDSIVT